MGKQQQLHGIRRKNGNRKNYKNRPESAFTITRTSNTRPIARAVTKKITRGDWSH